MKPKFRYLLTALTLAALSISCNFLDEDPDNILPSGAVFGDEAAMKSVLANFYGRLDNPRWGQRLKDKSSRAEPSYNYQRACYGFTVLDEAARCEGGADDRRDFEDDRWRVYDYGFIRDINVFLNEIRKTDKIKPDEKLAYESEARFIRAWVYFSMVRGLGGVPLIGDVVFTYDSNTDIKSLRRPRASEKEVYDYIISECREIAGHLPETSVNSARATKWAATMLQARAALYAGSIARYNSILTPQIATEKGEVGIPASASEAYYKTALDASKSVIDDSPYKLMVNDDDRERNFWNAVNSKKNNTEVIWSIDHLRPGCTVEFTYWNIPASLMEGTQACYAGPVMNLVEAFEYKDNRNGSLNIGTLSSPVFYDSPSDLFKDKDARLWGTVIWPGAEFRGESVVLQAGQLLPSGSSWKTYASGSPGSVDSKGRLITSVNGPAANNNYLVNKTGFFFRKFLDEESGTSIGGQNNSEMWFPLFRISEAYLIAAECLYELGGNDSDGRDSAWYMNKVRSRAGISALTSVTLDDIVNENRVEFAFEDHRWWDLKRWRLAHTVWNGVANDRLAQQWALFPYRVNAEGNENDGKWVFVRQAVNTEPYPRFFQLKNYYNFIDQTWISNNPELVKNPYQ